MPPRLAGQVGLLGLAGVHNLDNRQLAPVSFVQTARLSVTEGNPFPYRVTARQGRRAYRGTQRRPYKSATIQRSVDRNGIAPGHRESAYREGQRHRQFQRRSAH